MNINNGLVPLILLIINCISLLDISEILIIQVRDNCDKLGAGKFLVLLMLNIGSSNEIICSFKKGKKIIKRRRIICNIHSLKCSWYFIIAGTCI